MIKFRILNYVLILLVTLCLLSLIGMTVGLYAMYQRSETELFTLLLIGSAKLLLMAIGLSYTKQSIGMFLRHGYFNTKSANFLTIAGYALAGSALVTLIFNLTEITYVDRESASGYIAEMIHDITVLLVGLALLGVCDIVKKGINIKLENDLTI
ncbi:hypothetical protein [Flavobacterium sp.]|uniref:hypothetical protein n=1 Tax=Flavobacterium sp. TaxID=239 RepID=UPI004033A9E4